MNPLPRTLAHFAVLDQRAAALRAEFDQLFSEPRRFVLELGCGHGHFLTDFAAKHPNQLCVGIDLIGDRIERALRKRDRARLQNLHFIRAEARLFLGTLPATALIETAFVLFPDPWPKLRHHKHRILQPEVLTQIAARAVPDCPLYFRTDHEGAFADTRAIIAAHAEWRLADDPWPHEFTTVFQSKATTFQSLVARRRP